MTNRVVRGGGWANISRNLRSAFRSRSSTDDAYSSQGFRLIQEDAAESNPVLRGCSWNDIPDWVYSANRDWNYLGGWDMCLSFRLVQEVNDD